MKKVRKNMTAEDWEIYALSLEAREQELKKIAATFPTLPKDFDERVKDIAAQRRKAWREYGKKIQYNLAL